eukprot:TRINITY_DN13322_c0_g1_i1.p1 TRINITY_DN13322_c0_g1~~TRINITY_DN13322_c0_g1_i1.p1  ORF type:complete len:432 (+),score=116.22 TRINITY_DN13322_c0_g1_i1:38-1333(+)
MIVWIVLLVWQRALLPVVRRVRAWGWKRRVFLATFVLAVLLSYCSHRSWLFSAPGGADSSYPFFASMLGLRGARHSGAFLHDIYGQRYVHDVMRRQMALPHPKSVFFFLGSTGVGKTMATSALASMYNEDGTTTNLHVVSLGNKHSSTTFASFFNPLLPNSIPAFLRRCSGILSVEKCVVALEDFHLVRGLEAKKEFLRLLGSYLHHGPVPDSAVVVIIVEMTSLKQELGENYFGLTEILHDSTRNYDNAVAAMMKYDKLRELVTAAAAEFPDVTPVLVPFTHFKRSDVELALQEHFLPKLVQASVDFHGNTKHVRFSSSVLTAIANGTNYEEYGFRSLLNGPMLAFLHDTVSTACTDHTLPCTAVVVKHVDHHFVCQCDNIVWEWGHPLLSLLEPYLSPLVYMFSLVVDFLYAAEDLHDKLVWFIGGVLW